jgi:UDP-N-acetyl-2-amino-2-deoxyglucuronate dehydrogenase
MLAWVFGPVKKNTVHIHSYDRASGFLELEKARIRWFLSINEETVPANLRAQGKRTYRSIQIEGKELEFSDGFTDLHTTSYEAILAGKGFRIGETKTAIDMVHDIRHAVPVGLQGDYHPLAKLPLKEHPFN